MVLGILKFFRHKNDIRGSVCPTCRKKLSKIPGKKQACPHCGELIYVRTRPKDNARILVNKKGVEEIEEAWARKNGTYLEYKKQKQKYQRAYDDLKRGYGFEPSENDVNWTIFNEERIEHALNNNWGFYRNTTFKMAEQLNKESKLKAALTLYLEVCLYDLNGANNPSFEKKLAYLAPGVIKRVKKLIERLDLSQDTVRATFIDHTKKTCSCPISAEYCWPKLKAALSQFKHC